MLRLTFILFLLGQSVSGCGGEDNISDCDNGKKQIPCTEKTLEEKGRIALDDKKFEEAAEYFLLAIDEDAENYNLYTLLATSYAGAAGFNLLDVTKAQVGGEGSILDLMSSFLPTPADSCVSDAGDEKEFTLCITSIELARVTADLPEAAKADVTTDFYKTSQKQLLFYGSASTVMQINRFTVSAETGAFSKEQLETMTEEDAVNILNTLASAGTVPGLSDEEGQKLQAKIAEAQTDIQSQDGGSTKEKLAAFLDKEKNGDPQ